MPAIADALPCHGRGADQHLTSGSQVVSGTACPGSRRRCRLIMVKFSSCCTAFSHSAWAACACMRRVQTDVMPASLKHAMCPDRDYIDAAD